MSGIISIRTKNSGITISLQELSELEKSNPNLYYVILKLINLSTKSKIEKTK